MRERAKTRELRRGLQVGPRWGAAALAVALLVVAGCLENGGGGWDLVGDGGEVEGSFDADVGGDSASRVARRDGSWASSDVDVADTTGGAEGADGAETGAGTDCPAGYRASDGACVDVDECAEQTDACGEDQECINSEGSYSCSGGPTIDDVTAMPEPVTPGDTLTIRAVVSDSDGGADIAGGKLFDPETEQVYGPFVVGRGAGGYQVEVTWEEIDAMGGGVETPAGGAARAFRIEFVDTDGNVGKRTLEVTLGCPTSSEGICDGKCYDFSSSRDHCGGCGREIRQSTMVCDEGSFACPDADHTLCQRDGEHLCADLSEMDSYCGTCQTDCHEWADKVGGPRQGAGIGHCINGTCTLSLTSGRDRKTCEEVCEHANMDCLDDVTTWCDGDGTPSSCGMWGWRGGVSTTKHKRLRCTERPPSTLDHPNYEFLRSTCYCR